MRIRPIKDGGRASLVQANLALEPRMQPIPDPEERRSLVHERLALVLRRTRSRRDRLFLVLHHLQGLGPEEVAAVMGCPVGEVEASLHASMDLVLEGLARDREAVPEAVASG